MTELLQMIINQVLINIKSLPYIDDWSEFDSPSDLIHMPKAVEDIV